MLATTSGRIKSKKSSQAPEPLNETKIKEAIFHLFNESQYHISSHRKNVHALRKLHLSWCELNSRNAGSDEQAERELMFFMAFVHCLNVILSAKKMDEVVGRLMRFIVGFIVLSAGKDDEIALVGSSVISRFVENLMIFALEGVDGKEKSIRTRLCQIIVACVNSVDELSDSVWQKFRTKMTERLFDKEGSVRVQAVHAMARLQGLSICGSDEEDGLQVLDIFMDLLQHDPSVEVRKAVLSQIDVTPKSLPIILARRRDVDSKVRKLFYESKLQEIDIHNLSIEQRDQVLRSGLTDRDEAVKQACIDMIFNNWIHSTNSNLIEFLNCLDVMTNKGMAESALECFFGMNPDMFDNFNAQYLDNLTVETAFILRVFCQYRLKMAHNNGSDGLETIQEMLPELSQMSQYLKRAYGSLLQCPEEEWEEGSPGFVRAEVEFVLTELLLTCRHLDFSDEVGRRALEEALLELLTNLEVSDIVFNQALKLLVLQSPDHAHFLQIASGLVADFKDVFSPQNSTEDPVESTLQKSLESLNLDKGLQLPEDILILANLRCLEIVRVSLSTNQNAEKEPILVAFLTEAVIPAVNSRFAAVQSLGLNCLGLASLQSRELATEYMPLFADFIKLGGLTETSLTALRISFDLLLLFGLKTFSELENSKTIKDLSNCLYDERLGIQTIAAEGFTKLLLHGVLPVNSKDESSASQDTLQIIQGLFYLYYHPSTESDIRLRQCLAYFFPAFALSKSENQYAIASIVVPFLKSWIDMQKHLVSGLQFSTIATQFAHLTDCSNLVNAVPGELLSAEGPHDLIAIDSCWAALEDPERYAKPFVSSLLSRLRLDNNLNKRTVKRLSYLLSQLCKLPTFLQKERTTITAAKKIITSLVELDDLDFVLDLTELATMRERLGKIVGPLSGQEPAKPAQLAKTHRKPRKVTDNGEDGENPLDDLDDILED